MCRISCNSYGGIRVVSEVSEMSVPLKATSFHTTERLLEFALTMLEMRDVSKIMSSCQRTIGYK